MFSRSLGGRNRPRKNAIGPERERHPFSKSIACVASVSVWFRSKERPRNGILGFGRAINETRAKKMKVGGGEGKEGNSVSFLSSPPPPSSFIGAILDSPSSFFAPKPHRNACYAGYQIDCVSAEGAKRVLRKSK